MDSGGTSSVIDEVEALFKKLKNLPDSVRQKALNRIQQKLPDIDKASENEHTVAEEIIGSPKEKLLGKATSPEKAISSPPSITQGKGNVTKTPERGRKRASSPDRDVRPYAVLSDADGAEGLVLEEIETKRGRKTKRINITGLSKRSKKISKPTPAAVPSTSSAENAAIDSTPSVPSMLGLKSTSLHVPKVLCVRGETADNGSTTRRSVVIDVNAETISAVKEIEIHNPDASHPVIKVTENDASMEAESTSPLNSKNAHRVQVHCLRDQTNNQQWYPVVTVDGTALDEVPCEEIMSIADAKIEAVKKEMEKQGLTQGTLPVDESCKQLSEHLTNSATIKEELSISTEDEDDSDHAEIENVAESEANDPTWEEDSQEGTVEKGELCCQFCDFKTGSKASLASHRRKHKENIPKSFVCPDCNRTFSQSCSLQLHMKRHRGERDFACSDCEYRAFTKVDLLRHQTIHTGERNKICEYCGKAFAKDSTLRDHVKSIHERKMQHSCEMCGFVTHRANNLRVHIRMRHHGEYNNHVCPVCGASVKQKNAFLEHMRSHTGERPYKCTECSASFACTARLNVHRNSVHGERQFKCGDCEKSFQTKHHLLRHQAIHTKERPYACPFCTYACNTQGNIAKHVRSIHNRPDFSYRKYKDLIENGGQPREVDPEWVRKGEEVTKEYLNELSEKMGRPITLDELWSKERELQKKKLEQEKMRHAARERKTLKTGSLEQTHHTKMRRKKYEEGQVLVYSEGVGNDDCDDPQPQDESNVAAHVEVPVYGVLSEDGSIKFRLDNSDVTVYREDDIRFVKNNEQLCDGGEESWTEVEANQTSKAVAPEHSYHSKMKRRKPGVRRLLISSKDDNPRNQDGDSVQTNEDVPDYGLLSKSGNIKLCLETDEVQVYTGDATRELPILQRKDAEQLNGEEEVETIQGYMNEKGQFVRCEDGVEVNEDESTVVVIINAPEEEESDEIEVLEHVEVVEEMHDENVVIDEIIEDSQEEEIVESVVGIEGSDNQVLVEILEGNDESDSDTIQDRERTDEMDLETSQAILQLSQHGMKQR